MKSHWLLVLLVCPSLLSALTISKSDGGYTDLVVAFEHSIAPDERIVDAAKALLRSASSLLHRQTGGLVYLKQATLALPPSWPRRPSAYPVPHDSWDRAHVRVVGGPGSRWPSLRLPLALNPRGCGQRGEHVLLPVAALLKADRSHAESRNATAYQLVREWARYRYGVFDEFGAPGDLWFPKDACDDQGLFACANASVALHSRSTPDDDEQPCWQKTTWQLIAGSDDFKRLRAPRKTKKIETAFREVQQDLSMGRHVVVVFDVSDHEKEPVPLEALKAAVASVVSEKLPDGYTVSLVHFTNGETVSEPPVTLENTTRANLADRVRRLDTKGPSCTDCGLRAALQLLRSTPGHRPEGSLVVLLSDGRAKARTASSSASPSSPATASEVVESPVALLRRARVFVSTVALGFGASADLERAALETGGYTFALRDAETARHVIEGAIEAAVRDEAVAMPRKGASAQSQKPVPNETSPAKRSGKESVSVLGARRSPCLDYPVTLAVTVPVSVKSYRDAVVLASLVKGLCPVVRAAVTGTASFSGGASEKFVLHDNGLGEDAHAHDGIYTGQFTKFRGKGRYHVVIHASNKSHTQFMDSTTNSPVPEAPQGPPATIEAANAEHRLRGHSTGAFAATSVGRPLVVEADVKERHVPPGRVRDLRASVDEREAKAPTVRLSWTSPGAHAFDGKVASLEIRASLSVETLLYSFHNATLVSGQQTSSGAVKPRPAFSRQQVALAIPQELLAPRPFYLAPASPTPLPPLRASHHNVFFALVAINDHGLRSEVSNIASAAFSSHSLLADGLTGETSPEGDYSMEHTAGVYDNGIDMSVAYPNFDGDMVDALVAQVTEGSPSPENSSEVLPASDENSTTAEPAVEQEDDGWGLHPTVRGWIITSALLVGSLLICCNIFILYCRQQCRQDVGPPAQGHTTTMTTTANAAY